MQASKLDSNAGRSFLEEAAQKLIEESQRLAIPRERFAIDNVLAGISFFRKSGIAKVFDDMLYQLVILEDCHYGFAYHNTPIEYDPKDFVNRDVRDVLVDANLQIPIPLEVALVDALAHFIAPDSELAYPFRLVEYGGTYREKGVIRARLITSSLPPGASCLLVGAVSEIAEQMSQKNIDAKITDLSLQQAGIPMHGYAVEMGHERTEHYLKKCEFAIVSGSAFATGTMDSILATANEFGTKLIFFMETGGHLAPLLMQRNAHKVVAEDFPFYDMPGARTIRVYESVKNQKSGFRIIDKKSLLE